MRQLFLPPDTINPISGFTRAQEEEIQILIGGRLPFDVYESLIRRGVIPYPDNYNRRKNRKPATGAGRKNNIMNKFNRNFTTITNPTQSRIAVPSAQVRKE